MREEGAGAGQFFAATVAFGSEVGSVAVMAAGAFWLAGLFGSASGAKVRVEAVRVVLQRALEFRERFGGTTELGEQLAELLARGGLKRAAADHTNLARSYYERALELAGELSAAPGAHGEPIHEWLEVRPFMAAPPSFDH